MFDGLLIAIMLTNLAVRTVMGKELHKECLDRSVSPQEAQIRLVCLNID